MKTETITEFLARGGTITKVPTKEEVQKEQKIKSSGAGPATLLTYGEAELYYSEAKVTKATKRKVTKQSRLDINALPEALRKKVLEEMKDELGDEDQEEVEEEFREDDGTEEQAD